MRAPTLAFFSASAMLTVPMPAMQASLPLQSLAAQPHNPMAQRIAAAMAWRSCLNQTTSNLNHEIPGSFTFNNAKGGWVIMQGDDVAYGPCQPSAESMHK